jgi:lysophospholipase L1-like esterase
MKYRIELLLKRLVYLIIVILALQVVKAVFNKLDFSYSYFLGLILYTSQFLTVLGFLFIPLFKALLKRFTQARRTLLIAWLLFIGFVVLAEGLCTYWLYYPAHMPGFLNNTYTYFYRTYVQSNIQFDDVAAEYNASLFYKLKPNVSCSFSNPEFDTRIHANKAGVRDDDNSLQSPSIICIGDSFTFGWGVEQENAFPQLLEKLSGRKVLNAGIPSYGTPREITGLKQFDRSCLTHLIIQYCSNDEGENNAFVQNDFVLKISSKQEYTDITRAHKVNRRYFPARNFTFISLIFFKKLINKVHHFFAVDEPVVNIDTGSVKQFLNIVAKAPVDFSKTKLLVFQLDSRQDINSNFARIADSLIHTPYYQSIFNNNLKVIDFARRFTKNDYFILDTHHINAGGHKKVAAIIANELRNF